MGFAEAGMFLIPHCLASTGFDNPTKFNVITNGDVKEPYWRGSVLEPIFSSVFDDSWMHFMGGEEEMKLIGQAKAKQKGPKYRKVLCIKVSGP